jgi:hypothetical protein
MLKTLIFILLGLGRASNVYSAPSFNYLDLSKVVNRGVTESFDDSAVKVQDLQEKIGFKNIPVGLQTFRGIPFQILDPAQNNGRSYVVLKGHHQAEFPEAVSIPAGHLKAAELYFLHTCRWGGTAPDIKVAEYDVVYDDGQVVVIPLHVGAEISNFWYADDTSASFIAWWNQYKNADMGINLFPWKNPRPDVPIQSIIFKSASKMPIPILFAVTVSNQEAPISAVSPKPEKTVQTDTSHWDIFTAASSSVQGTVLDMSSLLEAPAGKHGVLKADYEKLVFADGTPARFWGSVLSVGWPNFTPAQEAQVADRLASSGSNLAAVDLSKISSVPQVLSGLIESLKTKGIYAYLINPNKLVLPPALANDPAVISDGILTLGQAVWNKPAADTLLPLAFKDDPMTLHPDKSLPAQLSWVRPLGVPYGIFWQDSRPNEYLSEAPLLMASYGLFENWAAVLGMNVSESDWANEVEMDGDLSNKPSLWLQWPIAALVYLRGDLKQGQLFVLKTQDPSELSAVNQLKVLAHRSGFNPGHHRLTTDPMGEVGLKLKVPDQSFTTDSKQINWRGNIGVVQVESARFQAFIGFLGNRKWNNEAWSVETPNLFASICAVSLIDEPLSTSTHLLVSGVTRMENSGMIYNQAKTKLFDQGKPPVLVEPLIAKITLKRFRKDPNLKVRGLDANGKVVAAKISSKWSKNNRVGSSAGYQWHWVISWVPSISYLEIYR